MTSDRWFWLAVIGVILFCVWRFDAWQQRRQTWFGLRGKFKPTVIVHTQQGDSIEGILTAVYPDAIVVSHATYLRDDGSTIALEGAQIVPRGNVDFLQEMTVVVGAQNTDRP